jgi:CubicO group peptidase (beta-lactamase class C family)
MAGSNQSSQPPPDIPSAFRDQEARFARAFTLMRVAIHRRAFPAAALAVTYRRELVALQGFGRFTYETDSPPVEADTVFDLASVTKAIATTTMAMLLYERGLLDLGAPAVESLPEFLSSATSGRKSERVTVTVRHLLAHSSGLPAYIKLFKTSRTREDLFRAVYDTSLLAPPGTKAEYSDIGFILLGRILERLARETLDTFCRREIFVPLNMQQTMFNPPLGLRVTIPPTEDDRTFRLRIIEGEVNDENAYVMGGISGHAGLFAPAIDVARFAECMLRSGAPILHPATVELFSRREASPAGTSRALGWDTPSPPSSSGKHFLSRSFGHLGYTGTSLWIDPDRQLSVTLLTNRTWPDRSSQQIKVVRPLIHDAIVEALD